MKLQVLLVCLFQVVSGIIDDLPMPSIMCECFTKSNCTNVNDADQIRYKCINYYLTHTYQERWYKNISESAQNYVNSLQRQAVYELKKKRRKRQASGLLHGIRKEFRSLTCLERRRFINAVIQLKRDRSVSPNRYEAIAAIHDRDVLNSAHFGPGFTAWHRYYLYLFELALRRIDSSVTLPFWASTMENNMRNPLNSNMWTEDFVGNGDGRVITGPFAYWTYQTVDGRTVSLIRNIGSGQRLFTDIGVSNILQEVRNYRILEPTAPSASNLELLHNSVHEYVSGTMGDIFVAPNDPLFFLHHCFVDMVWERFRQRAKSIIGDAYELDYPVSDDPNHNPYRDMDNLNELQMINGYLSIFTDRVYRYEDPIECPLCGGNQNLFQCVGGRCIPTTFSDGCLTGQRSKRDTEATPNYVDIEYKGVLDETYQNSFQIDGMADVGQWAYIPVRIMYKRPEGNHFNCKTVEHGNFDEDDYDIYFPGNSSKIWEYVKPSSTTNRVYDTDSGASKIFVQSDGLTYRGRYIDYGILDSRQIVAETIAYVAVKHPRDGATTAYISAYDLHGHTCQPRCVDRSSYTLFYKKCSGVIQVTTEEPKMYGDDLGEAVLYRYTFGDDPESPESRYKDIFLSFMCEYGSDFPWEDCNA